MKKPITIAGLLVVSITFLGLVATAQAWEQVACDHTSDATTGTMNGMMGPGMMENTPGRGSGMGGHMGIFDRPIFLMLSLKNKLKLTPEQVAKLEGLRDGFQEKAEEGFQTLQAQYGELARLTDADKVDLARAEAALKTIAALESDLTLQRLRVIEEGKSVLTAEQWSTFKDLRDQEHCPGMTT